jgi:hypothetical protein
MPVPHSTKKSEIDTMPEPELNPVLNPLLAAHMGRWAEVYFTSLPENRDQAVSQLLRELQNESFPEPALQVADPETTIAETTRKEIEDETPGAPPQAAKAVPSFPESWSGPELSPAANSSEYAIGESSPTAGRHGRDDLEACWIPPTDILPQRAVQSVKSKPGAYRRKVYAGVALAIVFTFLLYTMWHGTKTISRDAGTQSALPVAAPEATNPARTIETRNKITATSRKHRSARALSTSKALTRAKSESVIGAELGGVNEFVTAERYLKGTLGTTPDSREAALWLWKAVGKKNPAAMIALSDLYLRGDGVPKSCDQARLLLDSAARKGETAAAERLRHLQAFGCE